MSVLHAALPSALVLTALVLTVTGRNVPSSPQPDGVAGALAITGVTVVPMTGPVVLSSQTVVFRGHRIAAIALRRACRFPREPVRVDGTRKFLIPGLMDAHVHLQRDDEENRALLRACAANGITTILNLAGTPADLRLRGEVARGAVLGPAILTSGPPLGDTVGQPPTTTPDEMAQAVAAQRRAGYDFIKLSGDLSRETYRRRAAVSRQERILLIGHAPRNLGMAPIHEERQGAVAHVEEYLYAWFFHQRPQRHPVPALDVTVRTLAADTAKAGTAVITTLAVYRGIADQIEDLDRALARPEVSCLPRPVGDRWGGGRRTTATCVDSAKRPCRCSGRTTSCWHA